MNNPHDSVHTRRILLCACGLTPQIVTETLYALAVARATPWIPHEIHLITTREGATRARLTLLDGDPRQQYFKQLCKDYGLPLEEIRFTPAQIHVIGDGDGTLLDDIRTPADNAAAADTITRVVRELTQDPRSEVHASIAGGRKTMGYYLGYALSLFGRPQDRVSHVLVSDGAEGHPEFFYPPPRPRVLYDRNNRPLEASQARVDLADIPFVCMRDGLTELIREQGANFSEAVKQAQSAWSPAHLVLRVGEGKRPLLAVCGGIEVPLRPVSFAFLLWFARRLKAGLPPLSRQAPAREELEEFVRLHRAIAPVKGDTNPRVAQVMKALDGGWYHDRFDTHKNGLRSDLRKKLAEATLEHYIPQQHGVDAFALKLPAAAVEIRLALDF